MTAGEITVIDAVLSWSVVVAVGAVLVSLIVAVVMLMHGRQRQDNEVGLVREALKVLQKHVDREGCQMRRVVTSVVRELGFDGGLTFEVANRAPGDRFGFATDVKVQSGSTLAKRLSDRSPSLRMEVESLRGDLARAGCDHAFDVCSKCGEKRLAEHDGEPDSSST